MIPKIIHCCWFGMNPIPDNLLKYMESWSQYCSDYEIKIWTEENFDVNSHPFTESAYAQRKYAYVSDYVRAYALFHFGGVYLDTDVELKNNLDAFLIHDAFSGFEKKGLPFTAVWGAIPKHSLTEKVLDYYHDRKYEETQETNTLSVSRLIIDEFCINPDNNELQTGSDGVHSLTIYPAEVLCLDLIPNIATHHFAGSWLPNRKALYKDYLHSQYYVDKALNTSNASSDSVLKGLASSLSFGQLLKVLVFNVYYRCRKIIKNK